MESQISQKTEQIQALTEQKNASEDRANRLEADLTKEREAHATLKTAFEAKVDENKREKTKVREAETSVAKQKELLGKKDVLIEEGKKQ